MKIILALDTSSREGIIALKTPAALFESKNNEVQRHNAFLLPAIQQLLNEANLALSDLDCIACSIGPGSFVGTRLAVSVAQGLAYALKKPVIPLNHLQVMAHAAKRQYGFKEVIVALDAKMQGYYFLDLQQKTHFFRLSDPHPDCPVTAQKIGDAWPLLGMTDALIDVEYKGSDLIQLAEQNLEGILKDPSQLLPLYLNDADNWKKISQPLLPPEKAQ
ncbi:MAG: tRNA (adenosine(37)-N6)-threonylcarbamoyltransferase complex dimerization subunit type 1 TsaB [Gammaproteobacteria bacterium]|jgi:tRNA threonylcarbamoyl adenosine modification protein YeaZ|nr:tRNA (adenosine(37)-N6)-threonylcarbamoyltransferase complex dimerization subunit type 1 TsaB [Gammaproteobacteria bacterium]